MLLKKGMLLGLGLVLILMPAVSYGDSFVKPVIVDQTKLSIPQGDYRVNNMLVTVKESAVFSIDPADTRTAENEPITLSKDEPGSWHHGTRLNALNARDVNACNAFTAGSLVIRTKPDGQALKEGDDFIVSAPYGMVGIGPKPSVSTTDTVYASYAYSLQRIDAVAVDANGKPVLLKGEPHISIPQPPAISPGMTVLLHVYRPAHATTLQEDQLYPVLESAANAVTKTTPGRIPRTLAKLEKGEPVKIVCWGDSVTAGGNSSTPDMMYVKQFERRLRALYPNAPITVENISYGGSSSAQWHRMDGMKVPDEAINFQRIIDAKPDLLTMEFVNDSGYDAETLQKLYALTLDQVKQLHCELILITPHFTNFDMMDFTSMRGEEHRPYVLFLYALAEQQHIAVADASSRWGHLWKEGIPYMTLLHNTINHPDDRGHALFADELIKCFAK